MYDTVFMKELKKDKKRYKEFLASYKLHLISEFDDEIISKLRKIYYGGFINGIIYLYYFPTDFETIGNKVELLCEAFKGEKFKIVHATTKSSRETPFYQYEVSHLDHNSYIEIKKGRHIWVYDLYSMLKFDKDIYERLEEPKSNDIESDIGTYINIIESEKIDAMRETFGEEDFSFRCEDIFLITMEKMEEDINKGHIYKDILEKEIGLQKNINHYDDIKNKMNHEEKYRVMSLLANNPLLNRN